jgi:hypothetical protein
MIALTFGPQCWPRLPIIERHQALAATSASMASGHENVQHLKAKKFQPDHQAQLQSESRAEEVA